MTMETDLTTLLKTLCPRVFPDVAPTATERPYVTYQGIGGRSWRYLNNAAADKRNTRVQINVWADTRMACLALIRQIEEALCASANLNCQPEAEPISDYDEDMGRYGCIQDFMIQSTR